MIKKGHIDIGKGLDGDNPDKQQFRRNLCQMINGIHAGKVEEIQSIIGTNISYKNSYHIMYSYYDQRYKNRGEYVVEDGQFSELYKYINSWIISNNRSEKLNKIGV